MDDEVEFVAEVFAFAVDVDPLVDVAFDVDLFGAEHLDMLRVVEEVHEGQGSGDGEVVDRHFVEDGDVEQAVGNLGLGGHGEIVSVLATVGDGDEPGFAVDGAVVDGEAVDVGLVAGVFAEEEAGIGLETALLDGLEESCDIGVEAYARGVDREVGVVDDDGVDGLGLHLVEAAHRQGGTQGYLEGAGQAIAAATGDDAHVSTGVLEALGHVVDAAVAAYGDDAVEAFLGGFVGQCGAMMDMFGVDDAVVEEVVVEVVLNDGLDIFLSSGAGDGVDDEEGLLFPRRRAAIAND